MKNKYLGITLLLLAMSLGWGYTIRENGETESKEFTLITYHNPDLKVDLGVGLWAWPLPLDYDQDGDMDLLVSCPDTPFNGLYFFENISGDTTSISTFKKPVKIGPSVRNIQLSYVEGDARLLGPGVEYEQFSRQPTEPASRAILCRKAGKPAPKNPL